jgi:ABC-type transport system involved in multi-copper enzyme maturation permease subunit
VPHVWRSALARGLGFAAILTAHLALIIGLYPKFLEQQSAIMKLADAFGGVLQQLTDLAAEKEWGYMATQQYFKFADTVGSFVAVLFAAGAVAGEAQRRTLEIWIARPVPRWRLLFERWLSGALAVALPVILSSSLGPLLGAALGVEVETSLRVWLLAGVHGSSFLLVLYGLAFLVSTRAGDVVRPVLILVLASSAAYAIYFVPVLTSWSPYNLVDPKAFLDIERRGGLDLVTCGGLWAASAALLAASFASFARRLPH